MIQNILKTSLIALFTLLITTATGFTQETNAGNDELTAKLKKDYPLQTCVVSGDNLEGGSMGEAIDYLYEEKGKSPVLIRFCCKGCIKTFKKDPAKYLKMLDEAAAKKTKAGTATKTP